MAILLTGGTGKTAIPIARLLQQANIPFLLASRRGETAAPPGLPAIKFDWLESSTWERPFQYEFPGGAHISTVYLIAPAVSEPAPLLNNFIDYAIKEHAVKRFVLLASSSTKPGENQYGQVWQHLIGIGIEYGVVGPTWFMDNLLEDGHRLTIKNERKIYTASGDGKIPFISATDIAAVGFRVLTDKKPHNDGYIVVGPELLTYDQIAAKLSDALGQEVVHVKLTAEQQVQRLVDMGFPERFAKFMASLEVSAANGGAEIMNDDVERVTGRPPITFDTFAQQHKAVWQ